MRTARVILTMILTVAAASATVQPHKRHSYRRQWQNKTYGKQTVARVGIGAGVQQMRNSPPYGRTAEGFGKRVGSGLGKNAVKTTVEYAVAGARHEDLRYHRSNKSGFKPRMEHALVSTVVTNKTTNGKKTVAAGKISGNVASGFASRAWQPAALKTASSGAASAGVAVGAEAGANVAQEFWPEIRHPVQAHKKAELNKKRRARRS